MSITMKNVKAITHNNKSVSKITDTNGNILWGSYDAFPYRKLEYIHFNGTDNFMYTALTTNVGKYRLVTFSLDGEEYPSDKYILGNRNTSLGNNAQRYFLPRLDGNGIRFVIGGTWTSNGAYAVADYLPANTKRSIYGNVAISNSKNVLYFGIRNENGVSLLSSSLVGTTDTLTSQELYLMACNNNGSAGGFLAGKVYGLQERDGSSSGQFTHNYIPCQRKSDNRCGLYDTVTNTFKQLQGSATTDAAAGPTVDEYWNLT